MSGLSECVRWLVKNSCEDLCQVCELYDEEAQRDALEKEPDEECCLYRRLLKERGCMLGISAYFICKSKEKEKQEYGNQGSD